MHDRLVIREHESARIGPVWDGSTRTVSRKEVVLLDLYQRHARQQLFDIGYRSITATNWVGAIGVGTHCIEVIPKIDAPDELKARENLLYMVSRAGMVPLSAADITQLTLHGVDQDPRPCPHSRTRAAVPISWTPKKLGVALGRH